MALFASGNGSNVQNIVSYFKDKPRIKAKLILTNKADAYVIQRAKKLNIPYMIFTRKELHETPKIIKTLENHQIDIIVLAGFLLRIPQNIIDKYPKRIINIHPALLPKYGGKGMYGDFVHKAVKAAKEKETGITIHYVNEYYDEGQIIFQKKVSLSASDTVDTIAEKVHSLEYEFFSQIIEKTLS